MASCTKILLQLFSCFSGNGTEILTYQIRVWWNWQRVGYKLQKMTVMPWDRNVKCSSTHTCKDFYSRRIHSYLWNTVSHVHCEVICSCYLLDGDSLSHTPMKEKKSQMFNILNISVLQDNKENMWEVNNEFSQASYVASPYHHVSSCPCLPNQQVKVRDFKWSIHIYVLED